MSEKLDGSVKGADTSMEKIHTGKLDATLSELVAAAGQVAFEYSNNDQEAYNLARLALVEFIKKSAHPFDLDKDFEKVTSPSPLLH
jgi:hypothetical protein